MRAKFLGHAAFQFDDLLFDPFISGNKKVSESITPEDINCKIICVTHDHSDHLGDTFEIAKRNNAIIVACAELASDAKNHGLKAEPMNIGGEIKVGDWSIKMVSATHSCSRGTPAGFVVKKDGVSIYHAGDTGLFLDMKQLSEENIDYALLPIGDRFTMGTKDAAKAAELINPEYIIPIHYNTWPPIEADPKSLEKHTSKKILVFNLLEEKEI